MHEEHTHIHEMKVALYTTVIQGNRREIHIIISMNCDRMHTRYDSINRSKDDNNILTRYYEYI